MIEFSLTLSHFNFKIIGDIFNYKKRFTACFFIFSNYFHIFFKKNLEYPYIGIIIPPLMRCVLRWLARLSKTLQKRKMDRCVCNGPFAVELSFTRLQYSHVNRLGG